MWLAKINETLRGITFFKTIYGSQYLITTIFTYLLKFPSHKSKFSDKKFPMVKRNQNLSNGCKKIA